MEKTQEAYKKLNAPKNLGKCNRCKQRDAVWETSDRGNLCNTCDDAYFGLE